MVDAVSTVGGGSTITATSVQSVAAPATKQDVTLQTNTAATAARGFTSSVRAFQDPIAGVFVTEQLDPNSGSFVPQSPQGVTLAYLRNGLTKEGLPKTDTTA